MQIVNNVHPQSKNNKRYWERNSPSQHKGSYNVHNGAQPPAGQRYNAEQSQQGRAMGNN